MSRAKLHDQRQTSPSARIERGRREESANSVTHALGVAASAVGGIILIARAARGGDVWDLVGVSVFMAAMIVLFAASTIYHAARPGVRKTRLKVLDHCSIYLLIAGTYTPFTLAGLRGGWGWSLFGVIWGLAAAGMIFKLFYTGRFTRISTAIYIGMGWLVVIAAGPMLHRLPPATLAWLLAGGIVYTAGTFFYLNRRLPYAHTVWHLFVLMGAVCHYVAAAILVG